MTRNRFVRALTWGLIPAITGVLLLLTPLSNSLETRVGLAALFTLRGAVPPPHNVLVFAIESQQPFTLDSTLADAPQPRERYAQLIRNLHNAGAQVIAFDMFFHRPQSDAEDRALAEAINSAGNVVLFSYLKKSRPENDTMAQYTLQTEIPPASPFSDIALAYAPFTLPKTGGTIHQAWLFLPGAEDTPALPTLAWQAAHPASLDKLETIAQIPNTEKVSLRERMQRLRRKIHGNETLIRAVHRAADKDMLPTNIANLYSGTGTRYLNLYGPPHTVPTLHESTPPSQWPDLAGKTVFVGYSAKTQPEQKDGFPTVFTRRDGLDLSGVEIAATIYANLEENRFLAPLPHATVTVFLWGILLTTVLILARTRTGLLIIALAAVVYLAVALGIFRHFDLWPPVAIPLMVQLPLALLTAVATKYLAAHHISTSLRKAFGSYVPEDVVNRAAAGVSTDTGHRQHIHGVCLATDAAGYTALAERLSPAELGTLLDEYFAVVFAPIRAHKGMISDVVGDAVLAIWTGDEGIASSCQEACKAAMDIAEATAAFNDAHPDTRLQTRIGIHAGNMIIGNVGALDHYEYRALGDIVNTSTRIEGLNKLLGTDILLSEVVQRHAPKCPNHCVGEFRLAGKSEPLVVYAVPRHDPGSALPGKLKAGFTDALENFREGNYGLARQRFENLARDFPRHGPTRFYRAQCSQHLASGNNSGIIDLTSK